MPAKNVRKSKVEGLYKQCKHLSWDRCPCPWWARVKRERVSLAKWARQPIPNKEMAKAVLVRMEAAVLGRRFDKRGEVVCGGEDTTFYDFLDDYQKLHVEFDNLTSNSTASYLEMFRERYGQHTMGYLSRNPRLFEEWLKELTVEKKWQPATFNRYVEHGRAMFNWAMKRKIVHENPFSCLSKLTENNIRERRFSPKQEAALLQACERLKGKRYRQVGYAMERRLIGALDLGLRTMELLELQVKHVDYENWVIHLPAAITKAGKNQQVIVGTQRCKDVLEARKELGPDAYVFGTDRGTFVASFDKSWRRLFEEAGLPVGRKGGLTWHDLRHEYCSSVADHGANIHELRELARHADIRTTQRYLKASDDRLRELQRVREKRPA